MQGKLRLSTALPQERERRWLIHPGATPQVLAQAVGTTFIEQRRWWLRPSLVEAVMHLPLNDGAESPRLRAALDHAMRPGAKRPFVRLRKETSADGSVSTTLVVKEGRGPLQRESPPVQLASDDIGQLIAQRPDQASDKTRYQLCIQQLLGLAPAKADPSSFAVTLDVFQLTSSTRLHLRSTGAAKTLTLPEGLAGVLEIELAQSSSAQAKKALDELVRVEAVKPGSVLQVELTEYRDVIGQLVSASQAERSIA